MSKARSKEVVELCLFLIGVVLLDPAHWQLFVMGSCLIAGAFWIRFKVKL